MMYFVFSYLLAEMPNFRSAQWVANMLSAGAVLK
jgi:hypothetical protein